MQMYAMRCCVAVLTFVALVLDMTIPKIHNEPTPQTPFKPQWTQRSVGEEDPDDETVSTNTNAEAKEEAEPTPDDQESTPDEFDQYSRQSPTKYGQCRNHIIVKISSTSQRLMSLMNVAECRQQRMVRIKIKNQRLGSLAECRNHIIVKISSTSQRLMSLMNLAECRQQRMVRIKIMNQRVRSLADCCEQSILNSEDEPPTPEDVGRTIATPPRWTKRRKVPSPPFCTEDCLTTPQSGQSGDEPPTPEDVGRSISTPPGWNKPEKVPSPPFCTQDCLMTPQSGQSEDEPPTPEDVGRTIATPPRWSKQEKGSAPPFFTARFLSMPESSYGEEDPEYFGNMTPPSWCQGQENHPTPAVFAMSTPNSQEKEPGSFPDSRRSSLSHEQQQRQHMFDTCMSASSSEFDEEECLKQAHPIDSKLEDGLAREVDSFRREHQDKYWVKHDYLAEEKNGVESAINPSMRRVLMNWLVKMGERDDLMPHTLHLAMHLVDRCLSVMKVTPGKLALLGCACMMLAYKFDAVMVDSFVEHFVNISGHTKDEMLAMETLVLEALEYQLAGTHVYHFLERFIQAGCATETQQHFAHYLAELAVMDYSITITHPPSVLAASIVYMTRVVAKEKSPWTPRLHRLTTYNAERVRDCVGQLYKIHNAAYEDRQNVRAVTDKYMSGKHARVSKLPPVQPFDEKESHGQDGASSPPVDVGSRSTNATFHKRVGTKRAHDELGEPQVPKKRRVVASGSAKRAHDYDDEPQVAKRRRMSSCLVQFSTPSMFFWLIQGGECRLVIVDTKKRLASDGQAHTECTKRHRCHQDPAAPSALS